ncbi:5-methylcytosine restriction system specificity protein McrC [Glutamicibacter arilaitensis]|uniref:5-methylcytosine restriction system specificity protein McrC n=1 Tax=Glutamicibacter arilaitensis TaxID=256701 RepID=UPI003A902C2B
MENALPNVQARLAHEEPKWFQASTRGNGIGLTVLKTTESYKADSRVIFIYILPKAWRDPEIVEPVPRALTFDFETNAADIDTIVLYEMDYLRLKGQYAEALSRLCRPVRMNEDDDSVKDALWTHSLPPTVVSHVPEAAPSSILAGFWELIRDKLQPIVNDPPPGISVLMREPQARQAFMKLFLTLAEAQVARRKPEFIPVAEPLSAVRGRLVIHELVKRKANRRLPVWCAFDDLDGDTQIWQAIRHAVERCSQEVNGDDRLVDLALEIDARLNDVSIGSVAEIIRRPLRDAARQRNRELLAVYRLALAILNDHVLLAEPTNEDANGVVFTFKVATSELWEDLLARAVDTTRKYCVDRSHGGKELFHGGESKKVDIHVEYADAPGHSALLIDGKYKKAIQRVTRASMADQYQIYAYANLWHAPAVLAYPSTGDLSPSVCMTAAIENRGSRVGAVNLPFPKPGQTAIPVAPDEIERLLDLIVDRSGNTGQKEWCI